MAKRAEISPEERGILEGFVAWLRENGIDPRDEKRTGGISYSQIYKWMRGEFPKPSAATVRRIREAMATAPPSASAGFTDGYLAGIRAARAKLDELEREALEKIPAEEIAAAAEAAVEEVQRKEGRGPARGKRAGG